jgi:chromosome segregation ATPase
VDILLTRVEKLRREVKQGRTAELDEMELAEQERKALMAELLDLEQALQRSRIQQSVPAENARLRLQVLRHTEELAALEGQGDPLANSRAQVRDLEAQLSRAKAEIRDLEDCLDHAQEDKDALASEVERWNQPRQA